MLFFACGEVPTVPTLEARQALVGGLITTFETGVDGTIGIANDEALLEDMPFNRSIPAISSGIFGPFLIGWDAPGGFRRLAPLELERTLDSLAPKHQECVALWTRSMEMWN